MITWIKWRIAYFIDRHYQRVCWARLVMWVMYPGSYDLRETFGDVTECEQEAIRFGMCCYCGKLEPQIFPLMPLSFWITGH